MLSLRNWKQDLNSIVSRSEEKVTWGCIKKKRSAGTGRESRIAKKNKARHVQLTRQGRREREVSL